MLKGLGIYLLSNSSSRCLFSPLVRWPVDRRLLPAKETGGPVQALQGEISLLQEQISHLQFVIHSQHQNLRRVIQEVRSIEPVSRVDGRFTARSPNTGGSPGFPSSEILLPTDRSPLSPHNTLFPMPSLSVCQHLECPQ